MDIYFDNGATTMVFPEVRECMVQVLEEEYGNIAFRYEDDYKDGFSDGLNRAIRIVKAGGKYE